MKLKSLLAAALLSAGFLQAQAQSGPYLGIISGYNSTWVLDQKLFDDPNYENRSTWNSAPFGAVIGYKLNPSSSFQIEVFKNNMGAEFDIKGSDIFAGEKKTVGEKRIELKYTSVPILYKFTSGEKVRFNFHFGPQFNFLSEGSEVNQINQRTTLNANLNSTDLTAADIAFYGSAPGTAIDVEIPNKSIVLDAGTYNRPDKNTYVASDKDNFNSTDIGAALGFGLEADITNNLYFSANLRFYYGFKDIRSDKWVEMEESRGYYDSRNNVTGGAQLGIHYRFDL
ncbi:outer membrane beta-barrel protein [Adhaeribacter sp. BT258]|uniref:Outer membrane beta-barrel protein n=1 Tax=Adhaeribacter terrigena TaxID=2793070 RepID=A0ABS1C1E3_9BACT|nr:outer membrane beta-barrel protein [Adhaeribacter terrigena]MBK0403227.1 outer membrane beta-barrel protein [Adhaeribacter terrigena]